jgi:hypothetical protein
MSGIFGSMRTAGQLVDLTGDNFPVTIVFRRKPRDIDTVEPGMRGLLIGAEYVDEQLGDNSVRLFFWMGDHIDYNRRMIRRVGQTLPPGGQHWGETRYTLVVPSSMYCYALMYQLNE